jgi:hypothetical protein
MVLAAVIVLRAMDARAQPHLPPPPPPPLSEALAPSASSSAPAAPRAVAPVATARLPPSDPSPPLRRSAGSPVASAHAVTVEPPAPTTRRAATLGGPVRVVRPVIRVDRPPEAPPHSPIVVSWSPVPLAWGRLGLEGELRIAPHHSLFGGLSGLLFSADRGGRATMFSAGFGFASDDSSGLGVEVGYHFWLEARRTLSGLYLGPSLVAGVTTRATAGDGTDARAYWGGAFDVGWQQVCPVGLTVAVGAGLGVSRMADVTEPYPRVVARVGWSF